MPTRVRARGGRSSALATTFPTPSGGGGGGSGPWTQVGGAGGIIEANDSSASVQAAGGSVTSGPGSQSIAIGPGNVAGAPTSTCIAGTANTVAATGQGGSCIGGSTNTVSGGGATCIGGFDNLASGSSAACIACFLCQATGTTSACVASNSSVASSFFSGCFATAGSTASGKASACVGGSNNTASGQFATCIGGGNNISAGNTASGANSTTLGGMSNIAAGDNSVAQGIGAFASRPGQAALASGPATIPTDATSIQTSELVFRATGIGAGVSLLTYDDPPTTDFPVPASKAFTMEIVGTVYDSATPTVESFGIVATLCVSAAGVVTVAAVNPLFANQGNYVASVAVTVVSPAAFVVNVQITLGVGAVAANVVARCKFTETN